MGKMRSEGVAVCEGVVVCVSCVKRQLNRIGIAICDSCGVSELHCGAAAVGEVVVCCCNSVGRLHCGGVSM